MHAIMWLKFRWSDENVILWFSFSFILDNPYSLTTNTRTHDYGMIFISKILYSSKFLNNLYNSIFKAVLSKELSDVKVYEL